MHVRHKPSVHVKLEQQTESNTSFESKVGCTPAEGVADSDTAVVS